VGLEKLLPVAEAEIMCVLWARGPLKVRAVYDIVKARRQVAYTTVMTTCNRLAEKGLLLRKEPERGYGYVYSPSIGEREFVGCAIADILDSVVRDYPSALALYLDTRRELPEVPQ
jgi:predicted transcriptional regulator